MLLVKGDVGGESVVLRARLREFCADSKVKWTAELLLWRLPTKEGEGEGLLPLPRAGGGAGRLRLWDAALERVVTPVFVGLVVCSSFSALNHPGNICSPRAGAEEKRKTNVAVDEAMERKQKA